MIAWALRHRLPLIAANLSGADASRIARGQPHPMADAQPPGWRDADETAQRREIADGHCGLLPPVALPPMARAQRARDATMADAVRQAILRRGLPVVLLTGNGHARRDLGVPRFLTGGPSPVRVMAVGLLEQEAVAVAESDPTGLYDWRVFTGPMVRPDPCEGLRRMMGSGRRALLDRPRPVGQQAVGASARHHRIETPIDLPMLRQLVG